MESLKGIFLPVQTWFQSLSSREKKLVSLAGGAVAAFAIFMILFSLSSGAESLRRRNEADLAKLQEIQLLASTFQDAESVRQNVERQLSQNNIQLISYLEEKGTAAGLEIPTMNPKGDIPLGDGKIIESAVELTLTDIPIDKLVKFLGDVETGPGVVKVKYVRIEPRPQNETLTAWTTIATYRLKQ